MEIMHEGIMQDLESNFSGKLKKCEDSHVNIVNTLLTDSNDNWCRTFRDCPLLFTDGPSLCF